MATNVVPKSFNSLEMEVRASANSTSEKETVEPGNTTNFNNRLKEDLFSSPLLLTPPGEDELDKKEGNGTRK
jgi:hypothetical protein